MTGRGLSYSPPPTPEEADVRERATRVASKALRPFNLEDDAKARFRRDAFVAFAKEGLASIPTPKAHGGMGLSARCYYAGIEEIARASLSMTVTIAVNHLPQGALVAFGTDEQRREFLPPLTDGRWMGAFSLSEPQAGSDAAALRLSARKRDGGYLFNGTKCWCSSAGEADLYLVMARTGEDPHKGITAFLVRSNADGFHPGKREKKLGLRSSPLGELVFENCFIPDAWRIGQEGDGLKVALSQLDGGRVVIGAASVGVAREALDLAARHHYGRLAQNLPVVPGADLWIAEQYASIQAARLMIFEAARLKDEGKSITAFAAQTKLFASDVAMRVTTGAVDCLGEAGAAPEAEVERLMRDAKALQIVEGTNQIQRLVLSRQMKDQMGSAT